MARITLKKVKQMLEEYAASQSKMEKLLARRDAAVDPLRKKYEKAVARAEAEFIDEINEIDSAQTMLRKEIEAEIFNGYDMQSDSFSHKLIETDNASVEINSRETRQIPAELWLKEVPKSEQSGEKFWETINILVGAAVKFRSDIVSKICIPKRTHSINIRVK